MILPGFSALTVCSEKYDGSDNIIVFCLNYRKTIIFSRYLLSWHLNCLYFGVLCRNIVHYDCSFITIAKNLFSLLTEYECKDQVILVFSISYLAFHLYLFIYLEGSLLSVK